MNAFYLAAAVLTLGIGVAHSWLGERYLLIRLFRRENLPHLFGSDVFTKRTLRFAWHLTTVAWWGFGALLAWYAISPAPASRVATIVGVTFGVSAVAAAAGSRGRHLSWVVFLGIAGLAMAGLALR